MTVNDLKIIKEPGYTRVYRAEDTTASDLSLSMKPGEMVKIGGTGSNFVTLCVSGDPIAAGVTGEVVGIVRKESTETTTVDGTVEVTLIYPMSTVIRGKAQNATNINTTVKLNALLYDWVLLDVVTGGGAMTIHENETSDRDVNGLNIIGGDIVAGTLDVIVSARVTAAASTVTGP